MENDIYLIFRNPFNKMGAHENNGNHKDYDDGNNNNNHMQERRENIKDVI